MVTDGETNTLYVSEKLKKRSTFWLQFESILTSKKIEYHLLPFTRDIWAVDYMPIQIDENKFIQFKYEPDYLQNREFISTQTKAKLVCEAIGIKPVESELKIDGGNVIKGKNWAILTDKIFKENRFFEKEKLVAELERLFLTRIVIIPQDPYDYLGHADGIVRYYSEDAVLINRGEHGQGAALHKKLKRVLRASGIESIEIPHQPCSTNSSNAHGFYINFLQMKNFILVPLFNLKQDETAVRFFEQLYPNQSVETIDSREISKDNGVLNCVTWNIKSF